MSSDESRYRADVERMLADLEAQEAIASDNELVDNWASHFVDQGFKLDSAAAIHQSCLQTLQRSTRRRDAERLAGQIRTKFEWGCYRRDKSN